MPKNPENPKASSPPTRETKITLLREKKDVKIGHDIPDKYLDDLFQNQIHDKDNLLPDEEIRSDGKIYKKVPKEKDSDNK